MKNNLLQIIQHYEINNQQRKFVEECYELIEAILHYENSRYFNDEYGVDDNKHIVEEIADVMVMLKQFQYYYDIQDSEIEKIMLEKIQRQLGRMESDKE